MRLHHLTVTAFGPFAGTEQVDFDELNAAGLFLLTGPTGAGKTSLLDAISFALYGSVPGARGVKTLASQHADEQLRPEVRLEFTVAERRLVLVRSPEWARPKRRGSGIRIEPARAQLSEWRDDELVGLSTRAQEIGHLVSGLLGMTAGQFQQVAMLPQGEFAHFLQADSQQRHDVLQHLFRTDRFARIEDWVAGHSKQLRERSVSEERQVTRLLDAVAEQAGCELPGQAHEGGATEAPAARAWVDQVLAQTRRELTAATQERERSGRRLAEATAALESARERAEALARHGRALADLDQLEATSETAERTTAALRADRAARSCLPLLRRHETAESELARATQERATLLWSVVDQVPDPSRIATVIGVTRDRIATLRGLAPRVAEHAEAQTRQHEAEHRFTEATEALGVLRSELWALPERRQVLRERRDELATLAAQSEPREQARQALRTRLDAALELTSATRARQRAEDTCREVVDHAQHARERHLQLLRDRIAGMAAELAAGLQEASPCPVCGSPEHPAPAAAAAGHVAVDEDALTAAEAAARTAEQDRSRAERAAAEARDLVSGLAAQVGDGDRDSLTLAVAEADATVAEAFAAAHELPEVETGLAQVEDDQARLATEVGELERSAATAAEQIAAAEETLASVRRAVAEAAPELEHLEELAEHLEHTQRLLDRLTRAEAAVAAHDSVRARIDAQLQEAQEAAAAAGFADPDEARAAVLDDHQRDDGETMLRDRELRREAARRVLEQQRTGESALTAPPDLTALATAVDEAAAVHDDAGVRQTRAQLTRDAVTRAADRLTTALQAWEPARDRAARAESMARLVRGMSGDNQRQLRLSSYVLATRLDQVVAAANERLGEMRDHRYLLERTDRVHRKGSQAGLGLQVIDEWTGEVRDPSTLSGGETFFVSLSLALGLADVVTHEAGGTMIETLFVDEGFGSLDPDTLDDVLDRLDTLREGGRAVGLVSHVAEIRNRVPTQLHVDKQRHGSSVSVHTSVA